MAEPPVHVLHVDDDGTFGRLVAASLEREAGQFDVVTVNGSDKALARLDAGDVDCVVSDYDMPGTDGLELLEVVRARYGQMPFVLFTGKGSEEIASAAISAGVDEYIQKSAGTEQFALLANRVLTVVERDRARRERERLQSDLRNEREHFQMALRDSPVVAFRQDAALRYTWLGNPHPDFGGESILGMSDEDLLEPAAAEAVTAPKRAALESGQRVRRRVSYRLPSGPVVYDLTVDPVHDDDGAIVGIACVAVELDTSDATEADRGREASTVERSGDQPDPRSESHG
ncbi:response regulator [Salinirubellus salinus]|uniref:Response regulator n=1 Tax=Salinirubellus salinus TaxID=1364945 RepID=A0A9E7U972_9EURY|nr:response regulator [Salinirubellus salinus]UWM55651.1 response regulator [Salinirubellus salinus]